MKKALFMLAALIFVFSNANAQIQTINYGSLTLNPSFQATNWLERWNLTQADLTLSYTIDMRNITQPAAGATSYTEVGIRQYGAGNFNPGPWNTYQGGAGGWMTSLVGDLTPSPGTQSLHDKHNLGASGGRGEGDYDATDPNTIIGPSGTTANYGIWFDRDGVDPWQDDDPNTPAPGGSAVPWGVQNGGTYNTNGIYNIVINYHAINSGLGTMFATLNGIPTGFWTAGHKNAQPEFYPAGLSFKGNMLDMQVFAGIWAPDNTYGPVHLNNLTVQGYLIPEPGTILLLGSGFLGLGLIGWYRRRKA